jgi:sugar phosphate isomerase/epimerase
MYRLAVCNELWGDAPIEEVFDRAASLGYEGVEIAPFILAESVEQVSAARRKAIRRSAEASGVQVVGLHWLFASPPGLHLTTLDELAWQRSVEYLKALVRFCGDLGGSIMVHGSPNQRNVAPGQDLADACKRASDALRQAGHVAAERGVTICFEALRPEETNFVNTAEQAMQLVGQADHPHVGIMLDVKAMSAMPDGIAGTIRRFGRVARHVHANDPSGRGPGMNGIDFGPIMKALRESGFAGWVSVEPFDYRPDADTVARTAIETLRKAME